MIKNKLNAKNLSAFGKEGRCKKKEADGRQVLVGKERDYVICNRNKESNLRFKPKNNVA